MGTYAERLRAAYQFTREAQDAFAVESLRRSKTANEDGSFAKRDRVRAREGAPARPT
jgi:acetyl-CoA C-acetyltransferase